MSGIYWTSTTGLSVLERMPRLAGMGHQRDRTCLDCGKLFLVKLEEKLAHRRNFCSQRCEVRFRRQFDTCFVEGCRRQHLAKGRCAEHARMPVGIGSNGLVRLSNHLSVGRLNPLLNYGLARRQTFSANGTLPPDDWSPPENGARGRWRRIVGKYRELDRRFTADLLDADTKVSQPLSSGIDPQTEIDQTRFLRSPLM